MTDDRLVWGALSTRKTVCTHTCVCVCREGSEEEVPYKVIVAETGTFSRLALLNLLDPTIPGASKSPDLEYCSALMMAGRKASLVLRCTERKSKYKPHSPSAEHVSSHSLACEPSTHHLLPELLCHHPAPSASLPSCGFGRTHWWSLVNKSSVCFPLGKVTFPLLYE